MWSSRADASEGADLSLKPVLKRWVIRSLEAYLSFPKLLASLLVGEHKANSRLRSCALDKLVALPVLFKDRHGLEYLIYPKDWTSYDRFYQFGSWEIEQEFCVQNLRPGMTVIDAGANYGTYALLFCKLVGCENVHAFEPESASYRRLKQNLALNEFVGAHLNHAALFSRSLPEMTLNVFPEEWHGSSTLGNLEATIDGRAVRAVSKETIPAIALDDYCDSHGLTHIDLLKIDVEGAEPDVLKGSERLLNAGAIKWILFEVYAIGLRAMGHESADIFRFLRSKNYEIFTFHRTGSLELITNEPAVEYSNFIAKLKT